MLAVSLVTAAVVLVVVAPRVLARWTGLRRSPRAALVLWQAMALSGTVCVLAAAPVALVRVAPWRSDGLQSAVAVASLVLAAIVLARLLHHAHVVGSALRAARREQRTLVDLVGTHAEEGVRVLPHAAMRAYCVPGLRRRVVLTDGALTLPEEQLRAVLAHERAHLRARHDLVLELFTVLHRAAPRPVRAPEALHEVRLLVEILADRSARRACGPLPVGRAIVALAGTPAPSGSLGVGALDLASRDSATSVTVAGSTAAWATGTSAVRLRLLVTADAHPVLGSALYLTSALVLALPVLGIVVTVLP